MKHLLFLLCLAAGALSLPFPQSAIQAQAPANSSIEPILGLAFSEVNPGTVVVTAVDSGSPFEKLGFKTGDVILSVGEREITTAKQLDTSLRSLKVKDRAVIKVKRGDRTLDAVLVVPDTTSRVGFFGSSLELNSEGRAQVVEVSPNTPAAKAGLQPHDIVLSVDEFAPDSLSKLVEYTTKLVRTKQPGDKVALRISRSMKEQPVILVVGETANGSTARRTPDEKAGAPMVLGLALKERGNSVIVTQVIPNQPAAKAGIQPDDVIVAVGREKISSYASLAKATAPFQIGDKVPVQIMRGSQDGTMTVVVMPRDSSTADVVLDSNPDVVEIVAEVKKLRAQVDELSHVVDQLAKELAALKQR